MRLGLMVSGEFPCIRASKITRGMTHWGWEHDILGKDMPSHMQWAFRRISVLPFGLYEEFVEFIRNHPAEIIHIHNEPYWPVMAAKEAANGRPVILNVHDLACARLGHPMSPEEEFAFQEADGLVFVSDEQRAFAGVMGLDIDKPTAVVGNFALKEFYVHHPLPYVGGIVYEGGLDARGSDHAWRDLSSVADILGGKLHIFPGNPDIDYGEIHQAESDYDLLLQQLSRFDWGWSGNPEFQPAWDHAVPNKVFEYIAAGIPVLNMKNEVKLFKELYEDKLAIEITNLKELKNTRYKDPQFIERYKKAVRRGRDRWSMERHCSEIQRLYREVL